MPVSAATEWHTFIRPAFQAGRSMVAYLKAKRRRVTPEPAAMTEPSDLGEKRPVRVSLCDTFLGLTLNALSGLERPGYDSAAALRQRGSERIT